MSSLVTALVPMKGHSERVSGKNLRPLCGRPLFHWALISLQASKHVSRIVINTDSDEIAGDALKHFPMVTILNRPPEIRGDYVSMNTIIAYDLSQIEGEHVLQTHSTNPLLTSSTVDHAVELYFGGLGRYDSLFTVTRHNARFYRHDGSPINHDPWEMLRTQDLLPVYEENSNLYLFSRESFHRSGNRRIGLHPRIFEMTRLEAVDVDDEDDLLLAEMLLSARHSADRGNEKE